ncbi:MAG: DNA polymerase I [Arenicellales bacterium]|nr:DNA polymerase I [Arenicellales bacterium]
MNEKPLLVLVDGSSYLYRAFHALPNLSTSSGQPTGAIYGVISMIRKLMADYTPKFAAVVFDAKGKTFRHELYSNYKANRPPMPDELRSQIPYVNDLVNALGIPLLCIEGVEADDVIATLARQATRAGLQTLVSTGDKDLAQIVNNHVSLVDTMQDKHLDVAGVEQKFGVVPEHVIDYLALIGDTSDNIPGVPKVGPKTAAKWLKTYGSLEQVVQHADEVKGKVGDNLRASVEQLPLSKQLVTVKSDVDTQVVPTQLIVQKADREALRELYSELEFNSWLTDIVNREESQSEVKSSSSYITIYNEEELDDWVELLRAAELFAFDTETTSLEPVGASLVGISFALTPGRAAYVPCGHDYPGAPAQLAVDTVLSKVKPILEDETRHKVGQNLKYDHCVLAGYGVELNGIKFDTMLESYVLDSVATRHDMDTLSLKYLGHKTTSFEDVAGKGKNQLGFNEVPVEDAGPYAAEDADVTLRLHQVLWPKLKSENRLCELFELVEMPLVPVLSRVERNGVKIDADVLAKQSKEFAARITALQEKANQLAGTPFNIASPKQIQEILYDRLQLPVLRKTPKGQPSTAENVLQELASDYELPQLILEHRGLSKLKSTYTDKLPEMINPKTGRVHTSYHQAVAATGRLSSSDPNLQNIPIRTSDGRKIRTAFVPEPDHCLMSADYSQIELRIMAHLSQDEGLLNAFAEGVDVHRATAAEVFGVDVDQVSSDQRRHAKAINFGLIYGMSAFGLSQQLKIERSAAQEYINVYFTRYPGVKRFMDDTRTRARELGYVETVYGRRLYLPDIRSSNHNRRQYAERTAINAPMQGTAADIIKMAMLVIDDWLQKDAQDIHMIMQVHDELVFEVPLGKIEPTVTRIRQTMSGVAELSVPLTVDVGVGKTWEETHP